jgi:hypothetical protein
MIANGNIVNGSTINTHAPSTIFLRNQNNKNGARTKAFSYIPMVQKLLDLSLNFLSLFQIGHICCTVWQHRSQDQVDLMFNSSQRWQSRGYLGRENIFKFLQKVSDSARQMLVIALPLARWWAAEHGLAPAALHDKHDVVRWGGVLTLS